MAETRGRKPIEYTQVQKNRMELSGKRIRTLIKKSGMSQRKIALALNVDPKMIRRYQDGKQMIPERQACILADLLNINTAYILCKSDYPDPDIDIETYDDEQEEIESSIKEKTLHLTQVVDAGTENFFRHLGFNYYHIWPRDLSFEDADSSDDVDDSVGTHFLYNIHTGKSLEFNSVGYRKLKAALMETVEFQAYKNAKVIAESSFSDGLHSK